MNVYKRAALCLPWTELSQFLSKLLHRVEKRLLNISFRIRSFYSDTLAVNMVRLTQYLGTLALLCSAVVGKEINLLGVAESEEYASGAVHARIMKIKMVWLHSRRLKQTRANTCDRTNGLESLLEVRWTAQGIQNLDTPSVSMVLPLLFLAIRTTHSDAKT